MNLDEDLVLTVLKDDTISLLLFSSTNRSTHDDEKFMIKLLYAILYVLASS